MHGRSTRFIFAAAAAVASVAPARSEISLSSVDTFAVDNGSWQVGAAGVQPSRVSLPGPDGQVGYLSHFSDGASANGRWLMWNVQSQWLGNYSAASVSGIVLQANVASGTSPVSMRIAFGGPGGWFYSTARSVAAGWSTYAFDLSQSSFTYVADGGGSGDFAATMSDVTKFQILAGSGAVTYRANGDLLQAGSSVNTILLDNISAIPAPGAIALTGLARLSVSRRRRR